MLTSYMDLGLHFAREQEAAVSNGSRQFDLPGTKIEKNHGANGEFQSVARVSSYLSSFACVHVCNIFAVDNWRPSRYRKRALGKLQ